MTLVGVVRHLVLVVLVAVASTPMSGCLAVGQSDADREAAVVADAVLAPRLEREVEDMRGGSPQSRVETIHSWLTAPDQDVLTSLHGSTQWVVGAPEGTTIPLVVYVIWVDDMFVDDSTWGRACRTYDVSTTVTWRDVTCPAGTPDEPPADAVSGGLTTGRVSPSRP